MSVANKKRARSDFQGASDAELSVLKVLWKSGPSTPSNLQERLSAQGTDWAYTTVQTLLHRLHRKSYVTRDKEGVTQVYTAAVTQAEVLRQYMDNLAQRVCDGSASPLVQSLSAADVARLRAVLDEGADPKRRPKR